MLSSTTRSARAGPTFKVINGSTNLAEDDISPRHIVSVVSTLVPATLTVTTNTTYYFVAAFRTSLDTARAGTIAAATADYDRYTAVRHFPTVLLAGRLT